MSNLLMLASDVLRNASLTHELRERVDYLNVAVMRGDPRFTRSKFASVTFDVNKFDADWARKGNRVPTSEEIFGG